MFLAVAALTLVLHPRPTIGLRSLALPALLGLCAVWALASSAWGSPSEAVPEAERTLLYVSAALALYKMRVARERIAPTSRPAVKTPTQFERAAAYRKRSDTGDPIGRLTVPRLDLEIMVVYGTDRET